MSLVISQSDGGNRSHLEDSRETKSSAHRFRQLEGGKDRGKVTCLGRAGGEEEL